MRTISITDYYTGAVLQRISVPGDRSITFGVEDDESGHRTMVVRDYRTGEIVKKSKIRTTKSIRYQIEY